NSNEPPAPTTRSWTIPTLGKRHQAPTKAAFDLLSSPFLRSAFTWPAKHLGKSLLVVGEAPIAAGVAVEVTGNLGEPEAVVTAMAGDHGEAVDLEAMIRGTHVRHTNQHQALRTRVQTFEDGISASHRSSPIPGFDDRLFQQTQRLHMTLGVMALVERDSTLAASGSGGATAPAGEAPLQAPSAPAAPAKKTIAEALDLLNSLRPAIMDIISDTGDISVPLTGLHIMNDKPDEAYVLWTGAGTNTDNSSLWRASLLVYDKFREAGFVLDNRPLKLHCTLVNSTFRRPRQAFSAAEIIRRVAEEPELAGIQKAGKQSVAPGDVETEADFGTYGVDEIHLWKMGSWDEQKRYVSVGHIKLK
ncbi:hypothetical protein FRC01_009982, partial [Tulasnella sp. 417]